MIPHDPPSTQVLTPTSPAEGQTNGARQRAAQAQALRDSDSSVTIGALIITNTILGVPYFKYSIIGPKTLV